MPMPRFLRYGLFEKMQDISVILKGIWVLILFDIIALIAFLFVPQGPDVLLAVAEDVGHHNILPASAISLVIALFFWSIAAEFCSRFLIYLSDNSGRSLAPGRVDARRKYQGWISAFSLFFPQALVLLAYVKVLAGNYNDIMAVPGHGYIILGIVIICAMILLGIWILYKLYRGNWIVNISRKYRLLSWMTISPMESLWVTKLYGILNDVRVDIPDSITTYKGSDLPRGVVLPNGMTLPSSLRFQPYDSNPQNVDGVNIWMFRIDRRFYTCLFRQLTILALIAFVIILLFSFILPVHGYISVGAIAIICFAFACWQIAYTVLNFFDKAQRVFPIRLSLIVLLLVSSFVNNDHPVRTLTANDKMVRRSDQRPPLRQHFGQWFDRLKADTFAPGGFYRIPAAVRGAQDTIPIIFVAAEGGALRTGAFTAMMLSRLTDSFPLLPHYLYCYSSVSGGTLGVNFYNAALQRHAQKNDTIRYSRATNTFFKKDFLAAVTGKMVFGEIINYFIPWHIGRLDRAIALERGWEDAWTDIYAADTIMGSSFDGLVEQGQPRFPAVFINTTEVETGRQCIWSNVALAGIPLGNERDLYARMGKNIAYSTAINLSSRFPLISPGAAFFYKDSSHGRNNTAEIRRHFIDGGYYENKGAETLLQVLQALPLTKLPVKPYILQFNFGGVDTTLRDGVKKFNEITEIVNGIYDTRGGRGDIAQHYLRQYVQDSLHGVFIDLNLLLTTRQLPLNWILSRTSVDRLNTLIEKTVNIRMDTLDRRDRGQLARLFVYRLRPRKAQ